MNIKSLLRIFLKTSETQNKNAGNLLSFSRQGTGIPVIFLHAFPLSRKMWEGEVSFFSKNFQAVSIDLPGFGESAILSEEETSMEKAADAVKKLIDTLFPEQKIILCGLSMGGYVTFEFVRKYGPRVRALVLAATKASVDTPESRNNRFKMIELVNSEGVPAVADAMLPKLLGKTTRNEHPEIAQKTRELILANSPSGIAAALLGMANRPDSTALLKDIRTPVLILSGEEDEMIKPEETQAMKDKLPSSRLEVIPRAGHLVNLEQPEAFDKAIVNFLKAKVL